MTAPLWTPSAARVEASNLTRFMVQAKADWGIEASDYAELHRWSVRELEQFWTSVWRFCGVIGDLNDTPVLIDGDKMPGAQFFPEARINFAENLLRQRGPGDAGDRFAEALVSSAEATERASGLAGRLIALAPWVDPGGEAGSAAGGASAGPGGAGWIGVRWSGDTGRRGPASGPWNATSRRGAAGAGCSWPGSASG